MKILTVVLSCLLFVGLGAYAKVGTIKPGPGVHQEWYDAQRKRDVPVRFQWPTTGEAPYPVVIFSHGLGGSREGATFLGDYWSEHGYFVLYVQHHGSDTEVWQSAMKGGAKKMMANMKEAANGTNLVLRAGDVHFVIDELTRLNKSDKEFKGKLDLSKIAMTGHSFGAGTTLAAAGQTFAGTSFKDPRIKCAIYFSPPVSEAAAQNHRVFSQITIPGMVMTGTEDNSPIGQTRAVNRRVPFDSITMTEQYLVNFIGGDHMIFSGRLMRSDKDAFFQPRIQKMSTAFLDAYLKHDAAALAWLKQDAQKYLQDSAKYELK